MLFVQHNQSKVGRWRKNSATGADDDLHTQGVRNLVDKQVKAYRNEVSERDTTSQRLEVWTTKRDDEDKHILQGEGKIVSLTRQLEAAKLEVKGHITLKQVAEETIVKLKK